MFHIILPVKPQENRRDDVNDARWETLIRRLTSNYKVFSPLSQGARRRRSFIQSTADHEEIYGAKGGGLMATAASHVTKQRQSGTIRRPVCGGKSEDSRLITSVYHLFTEVAAQ